MPLQPIVITQKYTSVFGTIGPCVESWGDEIFRYVQEYWKQCSSQDGFPRLKFEMSNEGYPHFHIGLMFHELSLIHI